MISRNIGVMLYAEDVRAEKEFWKNIGFEIVYEREMMGYQVFDMKTSKDSTCTFTVFDKEFILKFSPEVAQNQPSIMFECDDIVSLHEIVRKFSDKVGNINTVPFPNFNFMSPSGMFYAVKEVK